MPGICGFSGRTRRGAGERLLAEMIDRMCHRAGYRRQGWRSPEGEAALGRVSLDDGLDVPGPSLAGRAGAALVDGEVYDLAPARVLEELLAAAADDARLDAWLAARNGIFSAALWDAAGRRLLLVNDRFGMKPLYFAHRGDRLLFASEVKALLADGSVPRAPSLQGVVSFFRYGQLLGDHTLFESVSLLPPGAVLEYRPAEDRLAERRYFRLKLPRLRPDLTDREHAERLGGLFQASVDRRLTGEAGLGLSLSGGLDSRSILAAVDERRFPVTTVCLGVPGSIDQRAARRMAELTGQRHCDVALGRGFLDRFEQHLGELVRRTDGQCRSEVIALATLGRYPELGVQVLLRGHAGELLHLRKAYDYSLDCAALAARDEAELEAWLGRRLGAWKLSDLPGPLLRGLPRDELETRASALLREALAESRDGEPLIHRVWHLFLQQKIRRHVATSLLEYGSVARVRLPYLDNELVDALLEAPPTLKLDDAVQASFLARRRPSFLGIVNANTGTSIGAGPTRRRIATFRRRALGKLRVPGYQPYERLGLWLRRELRATVERLLLDRRCLDRGVFEPETVRRIVDDHTARRANHTYLLVSMMIFEVGQRMIVDGDLPEDQRGRRPEPAPSSAR